MEFFQSGTAGLDLLLPWALSTALLTIRLTVGVALSPALSAYGVPATVRIALTFSLALVTFLYRDPAPAAAAWAADPALLVMPALAEVFVGAWLGLSMHVVLAAFSLAGRLMDVQVGFGIGSVFDPVSRSSTNVLGSMVGLLGVALFFVSDANLVLAQLISQSIDVFPLGGLPDLNDPLRPLIATGSMFSLGLAFAAPVAAALLLTDLVVGVASRNLPQVNVLVLAIPIKVVVGYAVLALSLAGWVPLMWQGLSRMVDVLGVH